jgi:pyruvate ferredoxin oxidoreductase beta subunit
MEVKKVRRPKPVEDYLKSQGRYRHLFKKPGGTEVLKQIQAIADGNISKYFLVD